MLSSGNRSKGQLAVFLLAAIGVFVTVLPFFPSDQWWVRIWDFPRIQILVWCVVTSLLIGRCVRPFRPLGLALLILQTLCIGYQSLQILPYTPLYLVQVEKSEGSNPKSTVTILTANVLMSNTDSSELLALVEKEKPDMILLTEVNLWWVQQFDSVRESYPFTVLKPLDNTYGIALFSRLPLEESKVQFLIESDIPSIETIVNLESGLKFKFFGIHPRPPAPSESKETTERDAELVVVGKKVDKLSLPAIVAGDLNDVAWSPTTTLFRKISGMLDPRIGRGLYNSFHAEYPFLRFPLDHVFHTAHFRFVDLRRLPYIGSDHFPISVTLSLELTAEQSQKEPELNTDDRKEAEIILQEAKEKAEDEKAEGRD